MKEKMEDGLPEIAQILREKKPVLFILVLLCLTCFSLFYFSKSEKKIQKPVEESYAIQQTDALKSQSILTAPAKPVTESINPVVAQEQLAMIEAKKHELQQRLSAPLMLVNSAQPSKPDTLVQPGVTSDDQNTQFMNQASTQVTESAVATTIGPLNSLIAEGSLIHAILESATNSDLPGSVRAIVSEPSYSEDGTQVLIPRGSRLIGQYKSGMLQGQSRLFMVWTRVIIPGGISIQIGSSGVDSLGVAGLGADEINRHFWERFGSGSLLSIIGAGAANAGVSAGDQENSMSTYRSAVASSFGKSASQSLQQDGRIPPTLTAYQGKPIMVFVAKDLNFQNAIKQAKPKVNIF